jgi:AraC family transcriptional regulator
MDKSCLYTALRTHSSGWVMGFHEHPHFEITVVIFGSGTFYIHDQAYPIQEGNVILIPPNIPHNYSSSTCIRFAVLQIEKMPAELQELFYRMLTPGAMSYLTSLSQNGLERYAALFKCWINTVVQPLSSFNRVMRAWIELLLLFMVESFENMKEMATMASIAEYIHNNYDKEIRISELAKMVSMSENGFRSGFKKRYGQSPKQYLQNYRMSEAKLLLESTSKPIQQVAEQVGFPNIHAFSAWFQHHECLSPSDYRKEHNQTNDYG